MVYPNCSRLARIGLAVIALGATGLAAPQAQPPAPPPPAPVVVRAARMLDVQAGRMISPATVVVTGDRITAVNPA
ncbi:MAG TPA: hypothetical protein VFO19_11600, partial [Vicinamibacterales bacterium]|nr:hypothetical protein [Vicinamibacterales bacterium]